MACGIRWVLALCTAALAAQQAPFVHIIGPDAPKGGTTLFEDRYGGLWMAGDEAGAEGLTYFDGSRFVPVLKDRFPKVLVGSMAEDSEGGLWIASNGGLFRFSKGLLEKRIDAAVSSIVQASSNLLLATVDTANSSQGALVRIANAGNGWKQETVMTRPYRLRLNRSGEGEVMYPCPGGFCTVNESEVARWMPGQPLRTAFHALPAPPHLVPATRVAKDRFGCIWTRSNLNAWYQCPGESRPTLLSSSVAGRGPDAMAELPDGSMVITSFAEVAIGRPGTFRIVNALNGYPSAGGLLVGKDGTIWLGNAGGLFVLSSRLRMEFWTERDGLGGNTWSILPMGHQVFAIAGEQIRVLAPDRSRWLPLTNFSLGSHLAAGPDGTLLATSHSEGVSQITPKGRVVSRSSPVGVSMLAQTPDRQIWAVGDDMARISRIAIRGHRVDVQPVQLPFRPGSGLDMKVDPAGDLWACTAAGLLHKDETGWHIFSTQHGLRGTNCLSFAIDHEGGIWYGNSEAVSGFSWLERPARHGRIRHFMDGDDVGAATSHFFGVDNRGWIWRGAVDGVYVADVREARQGQWLHLNREDGLPGVDTNQRSFVADADGSVWFGIDNSVVHLSAPADFVRSAYAPDVFVSGFSQSGGAFQSASLVDHLADGDGVTAHIGSLQFDRRNALRLRYRVLPGQTNWKPERSLDIALGKLSWGDQYFQVQAQLGSGPWSRVAEKSFTVLRPFWVSWPVLLGLSFVSGAAGVGGYRWRRKRRNREEILLPTLTQWRLAVLSSDLPALKGTVLDGRFEVDDLLARGGFATVFKGWDRHQGKCPCAIKIFRQDLVEKSSLEKRFPKEATALQQIDHPNVVRIFGHGIVPQGAPYLAMEFIQGVTLRDLLSRMKLDRRTVARYVRQTGGALSAIHARGETHRDVKPENLMVRNKAVAGRDLVLIDFSIALIKDPGETMHGLSRAAGTIHYMAPEQAIGYAEPASDIHSLAKVVIEMLIGKRLSTVLPKALLDMPLRVRELLSESGVGLRESTIELLSSALEFHPAGRPKDALAFTERICEDLESEEEWQSLPRSE